MLPSGFRPNDLRNREELESNGSMRCDSGEQVAKLPLRALQCGIGHIVYERDNDAIPPEVIAHMS
jgi:hypothetical protein